ncbi:terminase large subunit domain-containing protein [Acetobacter fallax]|uniref:Terminase n=1 Tax=Acetobacter fallax TaxID=1737473 RepID=A0ABX0KF87_9PROT|nr:terminase family protein [Acetobacter fallax]NHO33791.1 terminase [Acetobacter fallax]NHO37352.1 terminase [Acetobacter fallax]
MNIYSAGWKSESRFRVAVCGRRFGKTFEAAEEMRRAIKIAVAKKISPENEIWYGAPTYKQAKKIFWPRLKNIIPNMWLRSSPRESDLTMEIEPYRHIVRVVGLENYDALRGAGLFFFLGDEWADVRPEAWSEVIRPMLSTAQGHALFIGTPKGRDHFHDLYLKGQEGTDKESGWWSCSYTTLDGGNVPAAEIESARKCLDIRQFRQEYEASFETFSGRCIYAFSREKSLKNVFYDSNYPVHVGLDFNVNPMSATIWQEQAGENDEVISCQIDEIILPTSKCLTENELSDFSGL